MIYLNLWLASHQRKARFFLPVNLGFFGIVRGLESKHWNVSAKKRGSINNIIKPFMQHELVVSTQPEKLLVKIGNLPPIFGVKIGKAFKQHLARTLKPKRHIQHRKHYVILHVILVTNWCAEKPSICHKVPYLPLCFQLKPRKKQNKHQFQGFSSFLFDFLVGSPATRGQFPRRWRSSPNWVDAR